MKAPAASSVGARQRFVLQKRRDTRCEMRVRQFLHRAGLRYRVDCQPEASVPRKADIVFRTAKVAVFIDGCFWHKCPVHWKAPTTHAQWWTNKVEANARRDEETTRLLERAGWLVIRAWEHEDPRLVADNVLEAVAKRHPRASELCFTAGLGPDGRRR